MFCRMDTGKFIELAATSVFTAGDTAADRGGMVLGLLGVLLLLVVVLLVGWGIISGWVAIINKFPWIPPSLIVIGVLFGIGGFIAWSPIFFVGLVMLAIGAWAYA